MMLLLRYAALCYASAMLLRRRLRRYASPPLLLLRFVMADMRYAAWSRLR